MSRGTRITPLRLSAELLDRIHEAITSNNAFKPGGGYNLTTWIRQAIEERLDKLARSRKAGKRKKKDAGDQADAGQQADQADAGEGSVVETPARPDQADAGEGGCH